jgi:hypothetical protein
MRDFIPTFEVVTAVLLRLQVFWHYDRSELTELFVKRRGVAFANTTVFRVNLITKQRTKLLAVPFEWV